MKVAGDVWPSIIGATARTLPRTALALDTEDGGRRGARGSGRVVLVCGEMHRWLASQLVDRGATLVRVASVAEALRLMATDDFDAITIDPEDPSALDLVRAAKLDQEVAEVPAEIVRGAAERHATTPVFVLPFPRELEYAVLIAPPVHSFLENTESLSLAEAILRLDVRKLLGSRASN